MRSATSRALVLACVLAASSALAGCFAPGKVEGDDGAPAFHISRHHRLALDEPSARGVARAEDPAAALERLLDTSLVVRVGEAGSYTLGYTTRDGERKEIPLDNMAPGAPRTVPGADAFAGATLLQDGRVKAERAPVAFDGLRVGDVPLGVDVARGASLAYDYRMDVASSLRATDVVAGGLRVHSFGVDANIPFRGALTLAAPLADLDGLTATRVDLASTFHTADPAGGAAPLVRVEIDAADEQGQPVAGGVELASAGIDVRHAIAFWFEDDRLTALQPQGGHFRADPRAYAWGSGGFVDEIASECAGKTRADACSPRHVEPFERATERGEKVTLDADDARADGPVAESALRLLQRILASDLAVNDQITLAYEVDSSDHEHDPRSDYRWTFLFETRVVGKEDVAVAAGTFDALRIVQEARVQADVRSLQESHYDWRNQTSEWREMMRDFHVDETVARHTLWLEEGTWRPLKVESETPVQPDAIVARFAASVTDAGWEDFPLKRFGDDAVAWTLTARSVVEATKLEGEARFSPAAGLALATLMGGGAGLGNTQVLTVFGGFPFGRAMHVDEATEVHPRPVPPPQPPTAQPYPYPTPPPPPPEPEGDGPYLTAYMRGTDPDGVAMLVVDRARNLTWGEVGVRVDHEPRKPLPEGACDGVDNRTWMACREGAAVAPGATVQPRDLLRIGGVWEGGVIELVHEPTGRVLFAIAQPRPA